MILPNADRVVIEHAKILDYLLNAAHPDNGGKAAFFEHWGFFEAAPDALERAIRVMISKTTVNKTISTRWGTKFVVDGPLLSPSGQTPPVRTVWIIDAVNDAPRLVTAYPA